MDGTKLCIEKSLSTFQSRREEVREVQQPEGETGEHVLKKDPGLICLVKCIGKSPKTHLTQYII